MLNNIKNRKDQSGFTIVELLIVIVVIAILAAITIVAYNGIQNRSKTSAAASAANVVIKKAEAANAAGVTPGYPVATTGFAATNASEADMTGTGITLGTVTAGTLPAKPATVSYAPCTAPAASVAGAARISYYKYEDGTLVVKDIGSTCTAWAASLSQAY